MQSIGNRVTEAEGKLSSQGSAITGINTELTGKASGATVQALSNTVTQQGQSITAQGQAITNVTASLGNSGGQNLFFNPTFNKESASLGTAEGWITDSPASGGTSAPSIVASWLVGSEKAQRVDVTGLNQSSTYRGIRTAGAAYWPKAKAGASVVASCYVRATAGLVFRIFIQAVDSAGTPIAAPAGALVAATGGTQRISYDYPNLPAGTTGVQVYFRLYGSDTVGAGYVEYTRAQLEIGTTLTGWKDNNAVLGAEQSATSSAVAALNSSVSQQGATIIAQASSMQALQASYRDDDGEGELADALKGYNSSASIVQEATVRATQNEATARTITQLTASVGENTGRVTELREVVTTNLASTASSIQQLSASVASANDATTKNTAAIQQTATAYADTAGKLTTMWSLKMQVTQDGRYVAAGIGLGIENTGAGLQSQFLVSADRFAIINSMAGGAISTPFVAQNGQLFLGPTFIMDGTITNAKIGSFISSTDYVAGQRGWILRKDGTLEINGSGAGGGRLVVTNRSVRVYDANNVKRVQMGDLSE
ncbi:DUF1983 domain-containing protein [Pseudomonas syringae pv. theae]|nr:DUF1983 domain-containing protein [Pseudomonas syringae pv. theae]MBL3836805.1 DUF1983 domain-containing protein [Pseudomonas syringae pv. theae]MBL3866871.1 DUF1983 domain-containing protein [Pseudomonas syringae pv. theae]